MFFIRVFIMPLSLINVKLSEKFYVGAKPEGDV